MKSILHVRVVFFVFAALFSSFSGSGRGFLSGIGVCTSISDAEMVASKGYDYIEESVGRFLVPDKSDEEFDKILSRVAALPIPVKACNSFFPGNLKITGDKTDHPALLAWAETALRRAGQAGVSFIVLGSGKSRAIPEGFPRDKALEQFIGLSKQLAAIAGKYGVTIVLEPLNSKETNFINTVSEGGDIVKRVNHPNFRLLADFYHMLMDGEGPKVLTKYGDLIKHTHIAEKEGRSAPGTHGEDFRAYFKALKKGGYRGCLSAECRWQDFSGQVSGALQAIRSQL